MRRVATAALFAIATIVGALTPARAQCITNFCPPPPPAFVTSGGGAAVTPLGWYGIGSIACAAVSPMIGTLMLGRQLTVTEVDRMATSVAAAHASGVAALLLARNPKLTPDEVRRVT